MADNTTVIQCKITDIQAIPNSKIQLVVVNFKVGKREWHKGFRLNYDRPISLEEFKKELVRAGPFPDEDEDFLQYVKQEADKPFTIEVEREKK